MKKLTEELAKQFAEDKFKPLNDWQVYWNYIHSKHIINAIKELTDDPGIIEKLTPLAWVHDIGKIADKGTHAKLSVEILENDFDLDKTDIDCILHHGSGGEPETEDGKIFRFADGISLFYPETVMYWFWAEAREDKTPFDELKIKFDNQYQKYKDAYTSNNKALQILENKYKLLFGKQDSESSAE